MGAAAMGLPAAEEKPVVVVDVGRLRTANEHINVAAMKPREVVGELDKFIIGQADAKKAVSIALRNRWRRMQLPVNFKSEIIPKNILMVGPTGVGKTEIARRLAKLAGAPFVKVEATKFTEVGFHGRDVDTIIRDLLEASLTLTRQLKVEQLRGGLKAQVERRILEALTGPDAREDTIESFRRLLLAGELDDRHIQVEVPQKQAGSNPLGNDFEMAMQGGVIDLSELVSKLGGGPGGGSGRGKGRVEKRKVKVKEAWSVLEDAEIEKKLAGIDLRKEAIELAEQSGIVFIDEIDKIVSDKRKYSGDASAEGVQRDLLPLIEGCSVDVKRFGSVRTDYILFICSGAFSENKPADMLAELQGRLPIRVELKGLEAKDLRRILVEPKASLIEQQRALIGADQVTLNFTEGAITRIADLAYEINKTVENIGARRLYTVLEKIMEDISYQAPDMETGTVITVDEALVESKIQPMLKKSDLSKFIL